MLVSADEMGVTVALLPDSSVTYSCHKIGCMT